jgi:GTP diphosphokinase / guanosine-3',5'-bis(diphosphate) 3'-diphosphatase
MDRMNTLINTTKKGELLNRMLIIAVNGHANQYDKGGRPYILHPLTVMHMLHSTDEELQCIAIGHDLVEDCEVTYEQLRLAGMTERIIDGIRCLTKVPGETYEEYKSKVKSNRDSVLVKMCDLRHNTDIRRLTGISERDNKRIARYHAFYIELQEIIKVNS